MSDFTSQNKEQYYQPLYDLTPNQPPNYSSQNTSIQDQPSKQVNEAFKSSGTHFYYKTPCNFMLAVFF